MTFFLKKRRTACGYTGWASPFLFVLPPFRSVSEVVGAEPRDQTQRRNAGGSVPTCESRGRFFGRRAGIQERLKPCKL